jgi:hypothetical protein
MDKRLMSKYSQYIPSRKGNPAKKAIHPIWRGIGCIFLIIIPFISYIAANFIVTNRNSFSWVTVPRELIVMKLFDPLLLVKFLYTAIFVFFLYLILTVITFLINHFFGPSRFGPYDVPPDKVDRP